jgi:hypothetical protein
LPPKCRIASTEIPASFGVQGPGEMTSRRGFNASISWMEILSFL